MNNTVECIRCGHKWTPYVKKPKRCPKCRSAYWATPYTRKKKLNVSVDE